MLKWTSFTKFGEIIGGTPFVPFKMPMELSDNKLPLPESERFGFEELTLAFPEMGMVFDLNYLPHNFKRLARYHGVPYYQKIISKDHLKRHAILAKFISVVNEFLKVNPNKLIGVCDLYGNDMCAYMVCKYMQLVKQVKLEDAIRKFEKARGHPIKSDLKQKVLLTDHVNDIEKLSQVITTTDEVRIS